MISDIAVGGFSGHQIRLRRESFAAESALQVLFFVSLFC